jgi:pilus assembly protein FimV
MLRKLVVVFTSVVLFAAAHAKALGLGDIVLDSALNQPLNAQIALVQLGNVRPDQISVQMANESDFARFSIEREVFLNTIQFDVESRGAETFVLLSTREAVREPYLNFVLETRWPSGRLLSEYTVLLDLPAFAANGSAEAIQRPSQAVPSDNQIPENQSITDQISSDFSDQPARLAAPADEPVPVSVEPEVVPEPVVEEPAAIAPEPAPEPTPASQPRFANADETVTIGTNDTLWDIALQVRPDSSVSVQQTMLALQNLNREAFIGDNINMVRRGQVLRVPTLDQIRALSAREAISEVSRQNQLFENRRNVPLASQPVTAQPQNTPASAPGNGELSVVSVDDAQSTDAQSHSATQGTELDARIASLEDALAVQQEEADRAALVNAELTARLGLLEDQIASGQEIIRLRDLELAQLQQALEEAAAAEPEPVDPPTVITMAPEKTMIEQILDTLVANTIALVALIGLIIVMLVFILLRRNRAADQAALAGIDGMPVEVEESATANSDETAQESVAAVDTELHGDLSDDELEEILGIAGSADAALLSEDTHIADEVASSEEVLPEEPIGDDAIESVEDIVSEPVSNTQNTNEVLDEVDALIGFERYDEAEAMLRDAIVAEPDRVDLRMKLLEVFVAKEDAVGFKLQETEIRDMGATGVEARIATLRSQLQGDLENEILEDGEEDFFTELNSLDDMELALDLEASADVDDNKVLAGETAEEVVEAEEETSAFNTQEGVDSNDIDFDFSPDEDEIAEVETSAEEPLEEEASIEMSFASPEPGAVIEDFDDSDEPVVDAPPEFDLSDSEEDATIDFEETALTSDDTPSESVSETSPESEENLIDFDFDFAEEETEPADNAPEDLTETAELQSEEDPEHEVDFDFAVIDEADEDDAEIDFLDDDEEDTEEADFAFDDSSFDLATDGEEAAPAQESSDSARVNSPALDDPFDDLQFVDDALESPEDVQEDSEVEDDEDFDFLSDADEAATKLDLARAYFEMGDHEGAREILEEVQKEGNEDQIKDATELLSKL